MINRIEKTHEIDTVKVTTKKNEETVNVEQTYDYKQTEDDKNMGLQVETRATKKENEEKQETKSFIRTIIDNLRKGFIELITGKDFKKMGLIDVLPQKGLIDVLPAPNQGLAEVVTGEEIPTKGLVDVLPDPNQGLVEVVTGEEIPTKGLVDVLPTKGVVDIVKNDEE